MTSYQDVCYSNALRERALYLSGQESMAGQRMCLLLVHNAQASLHVSALRSIILGCDGQDFLLKCRIWAMIVLQMSFLSLLSSAVHDLEAAELLAPPAAIWHASGCARSAWYALGVGWSG